MPLTHSRSRSAMCTVQPGPSPTVRQRRRRSPRYDRGATTGHDGPSRPSPRVIGAVASIVCSWPGRVIAYLRGTVLEKSPSRLIIEVGGVGYDVQVPLSTF